MIDLHDRTGERCVACRKGLYRHIAVRPPYPFLEPPRPSILTCAVDVYYPNPDWVRCSDCGATVERWREG